MKRPDHLRAVPPASPQTVPLATYLSLRREADEARRKLASAVALVDRQKIIMAEFLRPMQLDQREQMIGAGFDRVAGMTEIEFGVFLGRLRTLMDGVVWVVDG